MITLSMIVRDEAPTIARTLESVAPFVDAWVIADTGSVDETPRIVRETLRGVPGLLVLLPWEDFATTRNRALELAGGPPGFVMWLDADDILEDGAALRAALRDNPPGDGFFLEVAQGPWTWESTRVVRHGARWRFVGPVHEALVGPAGERPTVRLPGRVRHDPPDTVEAKIRASRRWARDVTILRRELELDPSNARASFYLAQTLLWLGRYQAAAAAFLRRIALGGWEEEVYLSQYGLASCEAELGAPAAAIEELLRSIHRQHPHRAEPLAWLEGLARARGGEFEADGYAELRAAMAPPPGGLLVDRRVYGRA
jgi:glycosyltransferase involved in cell wall biosynthesis